VAAEASIISIKPTTIFKSSSTLTPNLPKEHQLAANNAQTMAPVASQLVLRLFRQTEGETVARSVLFVEHECFINNFKRSLTRKQHLEKHPFCPENNIH
jgi:hypothetical protein